MAAYNPGTATTATKINDTLFAIDSFRGADAAYTVNVAARSCTCPHFAQRLAGTGAVCKHVLAVEEQVKAEQAAAEASRFARLEAKAAALPTDELEALLPRYEQAGRLGVALAIRGALHDRQQAAQRPATGTSTKTWGPTTDAQAGQWLGAA